MFLFAIALFCSLSYSYATSHIPHTNATSNITGYSIEDDNTNWKDVLKQLKLDVGRSGTDPKNSSLFDLIIKANAEARGNGTARSDSNLFLYQADIAMTKSMAIKMIAEGTTRRKRAVMRKSTRTLWGNNIKYRLASNLNARARSVIRSAIREWERTLPCKGRWREVRSNIGDSMYFFPGGGCYSQVGRQGGSQRVSIGRGCEYHGIAVHEIGHAMGFWHEQSRPDRDSYVQIHYNNIIPAMRFNFQKYSTARIDSLGSPYDYGSVMHYGSTAFAARRGLRTITSRRGNQQLGQRKGLSTNDIKQAQRLYGCTTTATTKRPSGCSDTQSHKNWCRESQGLGLCSNSLFKSYMTTHCCQTCRPKPTPPKPAIYQKALDMNGYITGVDMTNEFRGCTDKNLNCKSWSLGGYCQNSLYRTYMQNNCCQSCNVKKCAKDIWSNCQDWKVAGYCTRKSTYDLKKNCDTTCNCK